jgi:RNA recognition motif-containing protein
MYGYARSAWAHLRIAGSAKGASRSLFLHLGHTQPTFVPIRWAFVDFTSTEYATTALTNPRNHHLNGRDLVVEYASLDAVRRGGGAGGPQRTKAAREKSRNSQSDDARPFKRAVASEAQAEGSNEVEPQRPVRAAKPGKERKVAGKRPRPAPGAALALAKREQIGIVPSQGTRITFD